jgi:hypothetical protein
MGLPHADLRVAVHHPVGAGEGDQHQAPVDEVGSAGDLRRCKPGEGERAIDVILDEEPSIELSRVAEPASPPLGRAAVLDVVDDRRAAREAASVIGDKRRKEPGREDITIGALIAIDAQIDLDHAANVIHRSAQGTIFAAMS